MIERMKREKVDMRKGRSWAEVSYKSLENNYMYLKSLTENSKFLGLCKADGYGHGSIWVAQSLEKLGADMLAVACISEGIELRDAGITLPILILGDTLEEWIHLLPEYQLIQTVHSFQQGKLLSELGQKIKGNLQIHVKVDTGMGRLGFLSENIDEIISLCKLPYLTVLGIYTHFSTSDDKENCNNTEEQYKKFRQILTKLEEEQIKIPLIHCANSGATLFHFDKHVGMIRAGISLYGYSPDGEINENLKPVLSLYSRISAVRTLPKGSSIGYGCTHILEKDSVIAVLPIGYGDGYPRGFSNGMKVLISGTLCPIVGRVCMDMTMVDVTEISDKVKVGDTATLYGSHNLVEIGAKQANTISYELLCQLGGRVPRIPIE